MWREQQGLADAVKRTAKPFRTTQDLQPILEAAGKARFVLLGEASHGTSEFYSVRAQLSQQLIERYGCRFIAVEGDWPSCYAVNRYIKGCATDLQSAEEALRDFSRWPQWMWANREIAALTSWLKTHNEGRAADEQAGFYGLDVYSLWESLDEILQYLSRKGGADLEAAKRAFDCFEPYHRDEQSYGLSAHLFGDGCEDEVVSLLKRLQDRWKDAEHGDREQALGAAMNAMAVKNAETYYRTMIKGDEESWNVRDRHMVSVLRELMKFHGDEAKAIVWEHNTHIGDARATDMAEDGMVNVGQLLREEYGEDAVFAVGFGTYEGTVVAGERWGAPPEEMLVPRGREGSWEALLHEQAGGSCLLMLDESADPAFREAVIPHRAIGVVYDPGRERGNYVPTVIGKRYDAFIHIDRTKAVAPLAGLHAYV